MLIHHFHGQVQQLGLTEGLGKAAVEQSFFLLFGAQMACTGKHYTATLPKVFIIGDGFG